MLRNMFYLLSFSNVIDVDLPIITSEYNGQMTERRIIHAEEETSILLKCTGNGNPEPDVSFVVVNEPRQAMISNKSTQHYLLENLKCGDTKQCICTAESSGFNSTVTDVTVIVECKENATEYFINLDFPNLFILFLENLRLTLSSIPQ